MSNCDPGRLPLLTEDERLQVAITSRLSGEERARIGWELRAMGLRILREGLRRQFGHDDKRIEQEFRRRTLGPELAAAVEAELARRACRG
jgi:hypothetical protein